MNLRELVRLLSELESEYGDMDILVVVPDSQGGSNHEGSVTEVQVYDLPSDKICMIMSPEN